MKGTGSQTQAQAKAGSSSKKQSEKPKSPSPDTEELFNLSEESEVGDDESDSSETESDASSAFEKAHSKEAPSYDDVPSFSERSWPPTPKGAIDSEIEKAIQTEKIVKSSEEVLRFQ